jgi:hypothetical protein
VLFQHIKWASEGKKRGRNSFWKKVSKFICADEKNTESFIKIMHGLLVCSSDNNTFSNINTIITNTALQNKRETFLKQMKGTVINHNQQRLKLYVKLI